jgi:UDP-N-acetylmuramyl pentapeptide phosphotransferase/UDP-N-acetylglucosamine-1-phosphate transferase
MDWRWVSLAVALSFAASLGGTRVVLGHLKARGVLDRPTERSSHAVPTPRGAGIAVLATLLPAWLLVAHYAPDAAWSSPAWLVAAALLLAFVGWYDDLASAPIGIRLCAQAVAVLVGLVAIANDGLVFQGLLPFWLDRALAAFLWLGFLNLFNFMDGIDGMAAAETAAIGIGLALVTTLVGLGAAPALYGLTAAAAALGFLWWNWQPARVFLGDVGSVPLGYLIGWLLIELACRGLWAPAVILPLYYLADGGFTLSMRILRGERFWRAHRQHFYQRATQGGLSHARAVAAVIGLDLILIGAALWAVRAPPWAPLALGAVATALLLAYFGRRRST